MRGSVVGMASLIQRSMHEVMTTTRDTRLALRFAIGGTHRGLSSNINIGRNSEMINLIMFGKRSSWANNRASISLIVYASFRDITYAT